MYLGLHCCTEVPNSKLRRVTYTWTSSETMCYLCLRDHTAPCHSGCAGVSLPRTFALLTGREGTIFGNMRKCRIIKLISYQMFPGIQLFLYQIMWLMWLKIPPVHSYVLSWQIRTVRVTGLFPGLLSGPEARTFMTWLLMNEPQNKSWRKYT